MFWCLLSDCLREAGPSAEFAAAAILFRPQLSYEGFTNYTQSETVA